MPPTLFLYRHCPLSPKSPYSPVRSLTWSFSRDFFLIIVAFVCPHLNSSGKKKTPVLMSAVSIYSLIYICKDIKDLHFIEIKCLSQRQLEFCFEIQFTFYLQEPKKPYSNGLKHLRLSVSQYPSFFSIALLLFQLAHFSLHFCLNLIFPFFFPLLSPQLDPKSSVSHFSFPLSSLFHPFHYHFFFLDLLWM